MPTLNILKINSSPRQESSVSRQLINLLEARIVAENPDNNVVVRDLTNSPDSVSEDFINASYTPQDSRSGVQNELLGFSLNLIGELKAADIILIGMPIYNFGMPAALKAWVDQVCRVGETFQYSETGPEGLLKGKRAYIAIASGGVPIGSDADFATPHLKMIMNFIGVDDVAIFGATGLAMDPVKPVEAATRALNELDVRWNQ